MVQRETSKWYKKKLLEEKDMFLGVVYILIT